MGESNETPPSQRAPAERIPIATYRFQFNHHFTFEQAGEAAGYLRSLGISDCYASPLFKAAPQSTHGYDICGFDQFNPHLGNLAEFDRFAARLRDLGLGLLLDMVPNHMGADLSNAWWLDVLEKGPASPYASWFDIDWQPQEPGLRGKVLLPTLEDHYARVLEAGKLALLFEVGAFWIAYHDRKFPLSPRSYAVILGEMIAVSSADSKATELIENLKALVETLSHWVASSEAERAEFAKIKDQLRLWHEASPDFRRRLAVALERLNGHIGEPRSFDALHALLQQQHYRLAWWRVGPEEINYRRFFDITELVSLRMELPEVFQATHELIFSLLREGKVTGLRIDHPDGLWDPQQYFERLQEGFRALSGEQGTAAGVDRAPLYVIAEKILAGDEALPRDWPVDGTTGYDFLNRVNGLFVNSDHRAAFDRLYRDFTGIDFAFHSVVYASKRQILRSSFISELNALAQRLKRLAASTRYGQDFTLRRLQMALAEIIAAFPIYRTYIGADTPNLSSAERDYVMQAVRTAKDWNPRLDPAIFEFIQNLLLLQPPEDMDEEGRGACREFIMRFQQLTAPVMAKGLEDTAFYNFNRLISLNEVGGDPELFGSEPRLFHAYNASRLARWPHSLLATATHDTKRSEDARARINVLSEMPAEWNEAITRWSLLNADKKSSVDGQPAPDPNDEYLLYQTLVGAWLPEAETADGLKNFRERITAYMLKAIKEAKSHTAWTRPNSAYEAATGHFVENLLANLGPNPFLEDFKPFQRKAAFFGQFNSLSQVLLKMTVPGVPDFYQGAELWDFNLVDPDNRRPVDYEIRRRWLAELKTELGRDPHDLRPLLERLLQQSHTGQIKLYLIWRALEFRRSHRQLFEAGQYVPLLADGAKRDHLVAFARVLQDQAVITVVPRLVLGLAGGAERAPMGEEIWQDTVLRLPKASPGEQYRNVLTHEILSVNAREGGLRLAEALRLFPVAFLDRIR